MGLVLVVAGLLGSTIYKVEQSTIVTVKPGETGALVPTGDAQALADALITLMQDPEKIVSMGRAGRDRVTAEFSIEKEAEGIAQVYRTVLETENR